MRQNERRSAGRALVGLVIGGLTAAAISIAVAPSQAEPVVVAPAPRPAATDVPAPTTTTPAPAVAPTTTRAAPSTPVTHKTKPRRTTSCADAAMRAGRFDPSCSEYQGYLDPGTAAGREQTSGELQMQWACEQDLVPRSQCE